LISKKQRAPYFDLGEAHDAIHAMHGMDPSLLALQGTHPSSPHFLKQLVIAISCLPLLDVANFIIAQEVPLPSLNEKEETSVAIHIVYSIYFRHIILLGHIYFL